MGELKIIPPGNVRQIKAARSLKSEPGAAKADATPSGVLERPLALTPDHVELIKACAENLLRKAGDATATQIAHRFAPRAQAPLPREPKTIAHAAVPETIPHAPAPEAMPTAPGPALAPFKALASGMRRLTIVLVAAALLPNLTAAAFWLGLFAPPWSQQAPPPEVHAPASSAAAVPPVVSAPETFQAMEGGEISFPIALDGTDGVPPGSVILVSGLPPGSALSSGRAQGEAEWILRRDEIGDLQLALPAAAAGDYRLTLQLLAPNNGILADAFATLKVAPDPAAQIAAATPDPEPSAPAVPAGAHALPAADEVTGAIGSEESAANADPAVPESDLPPLPARRPEPTPAADDGKADWVRPTAYVNLRGAPSSSGRVLGTVAKGAKLRVLDRKSGWLKVANPETSKSGWIYSGNTAPVR